MIFYPLGLTKVPFREYVLFFSRLESKSCEVSALVFLGPNPATGVSFLGTLVIS